MSNPPRTGSPAAFLRRIGDDTPCPPNPTCPDIWELDNGDFAVIGRDATVEYSSLLPDSVAVGADERLVVVPRSRMVSAKKDLPDV